LIVLLVEDDDLVRLGIARALTQWGAHVLESTRERDAIEQLKHDPAVLIVDVRLADGGCGLRVAEAALQRADKPRVMAMSGAATAAEAFKLAQLGVAAYLPKPVDMRLFVASIESLLASAPPFEPQIAMQVGTLSYPEVLERVRRTMLEEALARTNGNKQKAAELLQVTRQTVQYIARQLTR